MHLKSVTVLVRSEKKELIVVVLTDVPAAGVVLMSAGNG